MTGKYRHLDYVMWSKTVIARVRLSNGAQVLSRIKKIAGNITKMEIPHKKISIMLDRWVQVNFKTEGGKIGGWAPIKRDGRILQLTGRLRLSMLPFFNRKDAGIGSDLPYSEKHEKGQGVKKRRMLPLIGEVKRDIVNVYNQHVKDSAK